MKKTIALILALIMAISLVACAPAADNGAADNGAANNGVADNGAANNGAADDSAADDDFDPSEFKIAYATHIINHPVARCMELGFKEACEAFGYQYSIVGPEGSDYNETIAAAEAEVVAGADAVMLWAVDDTIVSGMEMLKNDYGVFVCTPHVYYDQADVPGCDFIRACDAESYAKQVAAFVAERLEGKTGSIALAVSSFNAMENMCCEVFTAEIKAMQDEGKLQGIKVLEPIAEGAEDVTETTNIDAGVIQANPDLLAAVSWTGAGPVTWSNAARKCGKNPGDLVIVAMDYTADNLAEIASGYCTAVVAQPLYDETYKCVEAFDTLLRGGSVDFWVELDAPMVYNGGEGAHDPATYEGILNRVADIWG